MIGDSFWDGEDFTRRLPKIKPTTILGIIVPLVATAAALTHLVVVDTALAVVFVVLDLALVPGIAENYREKKGWSFDSTLMTTVDLFAIAVVFGYIGLWVSFVTLVVEGFLWTILTAQSVVYRASEEVVTLVEIGE